MPLFSIILRTKNEERWIALCLQKFRNQTIQDYEVILVDNKSDDKTVDRALSIEPNLKLVIIDNYLPGYSLNEGIRASNGKYIVCISAHCIPKGNDWLEVMARNFKDDPFLAGVYGRQIPMHFTSSHDKRDLIVTFGLDRRVQYKDPFFHNANSIIPREIWDKYPFDEETTNIEDRLWAKDVLSDGYHIVYEPDAPVYHHHGIYQNRNEVRVSNVIRIISGDEIDVLLEESNPFHVDNIRSLVIIPVRSNDGLEPNARLQLFKTTFSRVRDNQRFSTVVVDTDDENVRKFALDHGADSSYIRPGHLSGADIKLVDVLQHCLQHFESRNDFYDFVVTLEITHPFRAENLVELCLDHALETGIECTMAGFREYRPSWWFDAKEYKRIDDYIHRRDRREPIHVGLPGLCSVITPSLLRQGRRIDDKVAIVEVDDPKATLEIRTMKDYLQLKNLIEGYE